jgi:hypothetical protein
MQQLFGASESTSCCKKSGVQQSKSHCHAKASHAKGSSHHHGESQEEKDQAATEKTPVQHDHEDGECPCGRRHAKLLASSNAPVVQQLTIELQMPNWPLAADCCIPSQVAITASITSMIARFRPADLYGREILRAYQILRC